MSIKNTINEIFVHFDKYSSIKFPTFICSCLDILLYPYPGKSTK